MYKINGVCLISLDGNTHTIIVKYLFAVLQTTRLCYIALLLWVSLFPYKLVALAIARPALTPL